MEHSILIYICDDETEFRNLLQERIRCLFFHFCPGLKCDIQIFESGEQLVKSYRNRRADAVFLDICMPDMDGFQVSKEIKMQQEDAIIIYVTGYDDTVYRVWDFQPFWFVRKSKMEDVDYLFPRLVQELNMREEKRKTYQRLIADREVVAIDVDKVVYIESCNHQIAIHYRDGKPKKLRCRISDAAAQLAVCGFGRIQQGIIVNYRYIAKITSRQVIFLNGDTANVSRHRLPEVRAEYQEFLRSE